MSSRQFLCLILAPMALIAQEARDVVPLKNWSNPLYWRASQAEKEARGAHAATPVFADSGFQRRSELCGDHALSPVGHSRYRHWI